MQNNRVTYTVIEKKKKPKSRVTEQMESAESPIYVPVGNSIVKEACQNVASMLSSLTEKRRGISRKATISVPSFLIPKRTADSLAILLVSMLLMTTPSIGFVLAKDTEMRTGDKIAGLIGETAQETYPVLENKLSETLKNIKLKAAPIVKGMVEKAAIEKLEKADIKVKEVKREKMTYKQLVEKSDDLFFGEVQQQSQDLEGVSLAVAEADMSDELTVEMVFFGSRLAWPVPGYEKLSSHFGHRSSPGGVGSTNHQGIDIPAPTGTPIIAVKEGTVKTAGRYGGYGNCVIIDHENGYQTLYGHMSTITCNEGDKVNPGDVIGKIGSTGWSTGPHLHFGMLKNGTYVDPEPYLTGREMVKAGDEVSENENAADTSQQNTPAENANKAKDEKTKATDKPKEETTTAPAPTTEPTTKPQTPTTAPETPTEAPSEPEPEPEPEKPEPQPTTQPPVQTENSSEK